MQHEVLFFFPHFIDDTLNTRAECVRDSLICRKYMFLVKIFALRSMGIQLVPSPLRYYLYPFNLIFIRYILALPTTYVLYAHTLPFGYPLCLIIKCCILIFTQYLLPTKPYFTLNYQLLYLHPVSIFMPNMPIYAFTHFMLYSLSFLSVLIFYFNALF